MADPFRGHIERHIGCASHGVFLSCNYAMVVGNDRRRALRTGLQSCDLSCEGRSEVGRRTVRDPKWDYHRRVDWALYFPFRGQNDLVTDAANNLTI